MKKILFPIICFVVVIACVGLLERIGNSNGLMAQADPQQAEQVEDQQKTERMKRTLSAKQLERVEKREQRNKAFAAHIDSLILSRNFRFRPMTMQQQPAGSPHQIYNPNADLTISDNSLDVSLPYIQGAVPPYRMVMLNYITSDMNGYVAEQTTNGWTITFSSSLFGANTYTFKFSVYSTSGMATLDISTPMYNTVSYNGSLSGLY
ncbi:MAG: DUF4251 domain-containing protein [Rikenellaceae bacterium]